MKPESQRTKLITRYLLGELPEEERDRLEGQYFADAALSQEVQVARDDLIDAYVRGELPRHERERFEKYFMASPRRRERVELAATLRHFSAPLPGATASEARAKTPWWQFLFALTFRRRSMIMAVATMLVITFGVWIAFRALRTQEQGAGRTDDQVASQRQEQPALSVESRTDGAPGGEVTTPGDNEVRSLPPTPSEVRRATPRRQSVIAFLLTPVVRGSEEAGGQRLVIPRGTELVMLRADFEGDGYRSYRARLGTPEGEEVWSSDQFRVRKTKTGLAVSLPVPARLLKDADYILRLSGVPAEGEPVNITSFSFRTEKK